MDTNTFPTHMQKMIDSLPFPLTYPDPETYNPATWAAYPYHATIDSVCDGDAASLHFKSSIPYDSVVWTSTGNRFVMYAKDSLIAKALIPHDTEQIICTVWRNGYDDPLYIYMRIIENYRQEV